jgi:hypothetical protein
MSSAQARVLVEVVAPVGMHPVVCLLAGRMPVSGGEDEIRCSGRVGGLRDVGRPEWVPDRVAAGATCGADSHDPAG